MDEASHDFTSFFPITNIQFNLGGFSVVFLIYFTRPLETQKSFCPNRFGYLVCSQNENTLVTLHDKNVKFNNDLALLYDSLAKDAGKMAFMKGFRFVV